MDISSKINSIFSIKSQDEFEKVSLEIFRYQAEFCPVYKEFVDLLKINPNKIQTISDIPFLPVEFFKDKTIISNQKQAEIIFTSSGTTGIQSKHHVLSLEVYEQSFLRAFELFYGPAKDYTILALLPSYLERSGSSLVYMADSLIKQSNSSNSGFFLNELDSLLSILKEQEEKQKPTILLGVSYALLDLAEKCNFPLKNTIVMETGGMKGKRKELTKEELHAVLKSGFNCNAIHSEYGMTELLSQAYSKGNGLYECPPWMKIIIKELHDPFTECQPNASGQINIIDLANVYSCSFLATSDLGKMQQDGQFRIIGRKNDADIRGCNQMVN